MKQITFKLPTIEQVTFTIEPQEEDIHPSEQFATGDDEEDKKLVNDICKELEYNIWAWCYVKVTASYKGEEGTDYLGCCSYENEKDFIENSGYYEDMKQTAYDNLISNLKSLAD